MATSFRGRISQIVGDLVQVWDVASAHSAYLRREQITGGDDLRLNDEILVEGDEATRRARRLSVGAAGSAEAQATA
jgi:hypothetical protein